MECVSVCWCDGKCERCSMETHELRTGTGDGRERREERGERKGLHY